MISCSSFRALQKFTRIENFKPKNQKNGCDNWERVRESFHSALSRQPEERQNFVNQACGNDERLRAEVNSLLSSHNGAESFMETAAIAKVADVVEVKSTKLEAGECFGHYDIVEQIGAGGMGEVCVAKDTRLNRQVALKLLGSHISED